MGLEAVDLVVIPWPSESLEHRAESDRGERQRDGALFIKTWKALQRALDSGVIHAIGPSDCLGSVYVYSLQSTVCSLHLQSTVYSLHLQSTLFLHHDWLRAKQKT